MQEPQNPKEYGDDMIDTVFTLATDNLIITILIMKIMMTAKTYLIEWHVMHVILLMEH